MKVVTAAEMREIDRITIEERGMPGTVLMAFAGKSVSDFILEKYPEAVNIAVFSGTGNNGGDGFVASYYLSNAGREVHLFCTGPYEKLTESSRVYHDLCVNIKVPVTFLDLQPGLSPEPDDYDLVIDALTGTGFSGSMRGPAAGIIRSINESSVPVVCVDIPSGLPSDGQAPDGETVQADFTVTMGLPKISLVTYPGKSYTGRMIVSDIGFPPSLTDAENLSTDLLTEEYARSRLLSNHDQDIHKGDHGHLLLIGGFDGMEGAIIMTAMAALEQGVGLLTLLTTEKARDRIAGRVPEMITAALDTGDICRSIEDFFSRRKYSALVIGPGMGRDEYSWEIFRCIMEKSSSLGLGRVLIDGDGLYHFAEYSGNGIPESSTEFIITPHFMEASRILGIDTQEIRSNRFESARSLAEHSHATAVLKGPASVISNGSRTLINTTGSSLLATAGSGDVLSGIIGSLMLGTLDTLDAAGTGAWIHGRAADLYSAEENFPAMKATDIIRYIRRV